MEEWAREQGGGMGEKGRGKKIRGDNEGKGREERKREKMQKGICWGSICLYCYSYDSLSRSGETCCLPATYFHWQGSQQFVAWYYVAEYDWEIGHKIIYLLQDCQWDFCREAKHITPCVLHVYFVCYRSLLSYSSVIVQSGQMLLVQIKTKMLQFVFRLNIYTSHGVAEWLPLRHSVVCKLPLGAERAPSVLPALPLAPCVAFDNSFNPWLPKPIKQGQ